MLDAAGRFIHPPDVPTHGFVSGTARNHELRVIGLKPGALRALIDHEIAALRLHRALESLHGLQEADELLARFLPRECDAAVIQPRRDIEPTRSRSLWRSPPRSRSIASVMVAP